MQCLLLYPNSCNGFCSCRTYCICSNVRNNQHFETPAERFNACGCIDRFSRKDKANIWLRKNLCLDRPEADLHLPIVISIHIPGSGRSRKDHQIDKLIGSEANKSVLRPVHQPGSRERLFGKALISCVEVTTFKTFT